MTSKRSSALRIGYTRQTVSRLTAGLLISVLTSCGYSGSSTPIALTGNVHGGKQPIVGSTVQLYAAGTDGNGSPAQPLLKESVVTDSNGSFSLPAAYGCPSSSSQIFIVAKGGRPGPAAAGNNPALSLSAALGTCNGLSAVGPISINEVTTVGSVWPLAPFMKSATDVGSASADPNFLAAVATVPEFINVGQGTSPGSPTATSSFTESAKLYSLADLLADCVDSPGDSGSGNTPCSRLFAIATPPGGTPPTDTITAAIQIAQNPASNVNGIFSMTSADAPFQPLLQQAPPDWSLGLTYVVATPVISLATGTYSGAQQVSISDSTPGSVIYYTTDGTVPTAASSLYGGPISLSASATLQAIALFKGSPSGVAASTITILTAGVPHHLAFLQQPANGQISAPLPAVQVVVVDIAGNILTNATNPVTLSLTAGSGLTGTTTAIPSQGVATFGNLNLAIPGNYTLTASSPNLISATSSSFTVSATAPVIGPAPAKLVFIQQPSNAPEYAVMAPPVQVALVDSNGNPVTTPANPVTLVLISSTGSGGTLWTAAPQNGIATFSDITVNVPGTGYTLLASYPGIASVSSSAFNIDAAAQGAPLPTQLAFLQQPTNSLVNTTISPAVQVAVEDSNGKAVTGATNPVTLVLVGGTGLGGTVTAIPQNGIATFGNLSVSNAGSGYALGASSPGLASAVSNVFAISAAGGGTAPAPVKLAFLQQPSNAVTGNVIAPAVTVSVEDVNGNPVTTATNLVTLSISAGGSLGGLVTVPAKNGVATFSNLTVEEPGTAYTLSASSASLASATSTPFTITAPASPSPVPAKLSFLQQPANAATGAVLPPVVVSIEDSSGNLVNGATNAVTIHLTTGSGLSGTMTVNAQNGAATFSNLSISVAGAYTLSAASAGLTTATSSAFTISAPVVSPPAPAKLAFVQEPSSTSPGAAISPAVTIAVEDAQGNTVSGANNVVTLALASGSGLAGTLSAAASNGIATFSNLSVSNAGSYTLSASSPGLSAATSTSFTVTGAATCSISSFGAIGDGVTNNAVAIQNTFNYAASHQCTVLIPAGTFAYSGDLTANGIAVTGTGAASILKALNANDEALTLTGNGGSISNLVMLGAGTTRNVTYQAAMIWINAATQFTVQNVLINGGSCVGIYDAGGQGGLIQNNTVENTLADAITNTNGASNVIVKGNHILNSGDDGVSNNSYVNDPNTVHDITVEGNTIMHNANGRGMEVSGGTNITFTGNYVDNLDGAADMYIASESEYKTQSVSNITVTGNTFADGGPNQGSAIIYNSQPGATTISGVTLRNNQFVNPRLNAVQYAGSGLETGIVAESNTDYSTATFSLSSNPAASTTQTSNQILSPGAYTTPLVSPGGGCSFSGC